MSSNEVPGDRKYQRVVMSYEKLEIQNTSSWILREKKTRKTLIVKNFPEIIKNTMHLLSHETHFKSKINKKKQV